MKKYFSTITALALILLVGVVALMPHFALAEFHPVQSVIDTVVGWSSGYINSTLAWIGYQILTVTTTLVTTAGLFLSISINLTTHIKDIYESITAIKAVWVVVRDLSSMFIIFILLYYSILTIVGKTSVGISKLIVSIFIAGVFINFSLFFVKVAVDASNLISLQFYNAIAPQTDQNFTVKSAYYDGGLSNILLQSLKIQTVYSVAGAGKGLDTGTGIIFATIGGIIIMVTTAFSLTAAAIAFTARTAILLFIMAISPIFFAAQIFPKLKETVSKKLLSYLTNQLIFMPVYLFLMYVALKVISDPNFNAMFSYSAKSSTGAAPYAYVWSGIIIQYAIAILFINAPLVAAISMGAVGMKWAPSGIDISKKFGGFFGRNLVGRPLRQQAEAFDKGAADGRIFGSSTLFNLTAPVARVTRLSQGVRGALDKGAKGKYGGSTSLADIEKEDKTRAQFIASKKRESTAFDEIDEHLKAGVPLATIRGTTSKMGAKELEDLDKRLTKPTVAAALSTKQAENILKSTELSDGEKEAFKEARKEGYKAEITTISSGDMENILKEDFDEKQKTELKEARKEAFNKIVNAGSDPKVVAYMKNLSGKDLAKMDPAKLRQGIVIENLTPTQLKDMSDLKGDVKKAIGDYIETLPAGNHPAKGFIRKNKDEWIS